MRRFGFFELAGLALLALKFQGVVAGDAGVVACAVLSVIRADRRRVGVSVARSGSPEAAGCGPCKSEVTCHMVFSHRQVLV